MSFLPSSTSLGELELLHTHIWFDGPCLISCKDTHNNLYMGVLIKREGGNEVWLYTVISEPSLEEVIKGVLSIRDIFLMYDQCYVVRLPKGGPDSAVPVPREDIPDDWLPLSESFI